MVIFEDQVTYRLTCDVDGSLTTIRVFPKTIRDWFTKQPPLSMTRAMTTRMSKLLREELIGDIQNSMEKVFGDLVLNNISNPFGSSSDQSSFFFDKGTIKSFHYRNLSGGEKAAFDILLDIHLKKPYFTNAIYCIDEIESHLHTSVQGSLLKELTDITPNTSQLWITTHSLGVIRAAQEIERSSPNSVCIINFEDVGLDHPSVLRPTVLDKVSWEKMLSMTLDDISDFIAPRVIVVCEGSSVGNRRKNFDANVYSTILSTQEPGIVFVAGGASNEVQGTRAKLQVLLQAALPSSRIVALADRDDKSLNQIAEWSNRGDIVLSERNIESICSPTTLLSLNALKEGKPELRQEALRVRDNAIESSISRGNPPDDVKSAAGETFNGLKNLLAIQHPGENADIFMRDILAPLIKPGMPTYQRLKEDIIDKLT